MTGFGTPQDSCLQDHAFENLACYTDACTKGMIKHERPEKASSKGPSLMSIPTEVREMILVDCLVASSPITPYPAFCEDPYVFNPNDEKPCMVLFGVSRILNIEVQRIFYSKNTFRSVISAHLRFWVSALFDLAQESMYLPLLDLGKEIPVYAGLLVSNDESTLM